MSLVLGRVAGRSVVAATAVAVAALLGGGLASATSTWLTYHANLSRTGVDPSEPSLNPIKMAWSNNLDGARVYGQPVVADGRVFVATENDDVYALDAHDGHVLWQHSVGTPLENVSEYVCGDISPVGITSTPAIDLARSTLYVVAETTSHGAPPVSFELVGFNLYSGQITVRADAAPALPAGESLLYLQQRSALAIANGRVYVSYGGHDGDCGLYHGWVVGVSESGAGPNVDFNATPSTDGGAIWGGGGGPSVDSVGDVYVVTGNPDDHNDAPFADDVVKLGANLNVLSYFHDSAAAPGADLDLGTGDALLLPDGDVFAVGKTDVGYLLRQSDLHEVAAIPNVCGGDPDGGPAYDAATNGVYVPCRGTGNIQQVTLNNFKAGWQSGGVDSAPILVDGELWADNYNTGLLKELNPANGATIQQIQLPALPTFASPSAADGLLLVGTRSGVVVLDGPSGPPPPAPSPPPAPKPSAGYWMVASDGGVFSFGLAGFHGSLGDVRLSAPIVGMAATADGGGYWLVGADGGVFTFGDARFYGSTGNVHLNQPVVGIAAAPDSQGYWLVARDGGVFSFGPGARFDGSTGGIRLNQPVVGMAGDPATGGYWLVASDGGIFSFDAPYLGSTGNVHLNQPVVGMAAAEGGGGYWLVARDGGVFTFGPGARFDGSIGGIRLNQPIEGMAGDPATGGYWLAAADGGVFSFDAPFEGSTGNVPLVRPVVGITVP
jgi:outer membrane protein assembly factor BamB